MNGLSRVSVKITIGLLAIIELCSLFLVYKSFSNKEIDEIKEINIVDKKQFAMYVEQTDGTYKEYTDGTSFTIDGYTLNLEASSCIDNKGNAVEGLLSSTTNQVTVTSNKTTFCYLYFDMN